MLVYIYVIAVFGGFWGGWCCHGVTKQVVYSVGAKKSLFCLDFFGKRVVTLQGSDDEYVILQEDKYQWFGMYLRNTPDDDGANGAAARYCRTGITCVLLRFNFVSTPY